MKVDNLVDKTKQKVMSKVSYLGPVCINGKWRSEVNKVASSFATSQRRMIERELDEGMEIHRGEPDLSGNQAYEKAKRLVIETDKALAQKYDGIKENFLKKKKKELLTNDENNAHNQSAELEQLLDDEKLVEMSIIEKYLKPKKNQRG